MTPNPKRWLILFVILAAECMDLLDGTVVNVAAPTIHRDLHASSTALQWIVGGYALALAVGLLTGGRLGDLFGRRRMFLIGVLGFTVASAACGLAPSTAVLVAARLVQGLAGAMMVPQGLGVIRDVFPPDELPKAFGLFGPVMGSAALLGPIVGGGLVSLNLFNQPWRPVFLINVPLGLLATVGSSAAAAADRGPPCGTAGPGRSGARRCRVTGHRLSADPGPGPRLARLDLRLDGCRRRPVRAVRDPFEAPRAGRARSADCAEHLLPPRLLGWGTRPHAVFRRHGRIGPGHHSVPPARRGLQRHPRRTELGSIRLRDRDRRPGGWGDDAADSRTHADPGRWRRVVGQ